MDTDNEITHTSGTLTEKVAEIAGMTFFVVACYVCWILVCSIEGA
jgi:hypothetical protein